MSATSTGPRRRTLPTTRGTLTERPARLVMIGRLVVVDAVERGGEAVGVALAAHLAVGDDVDAGLLHVADGEDRGVVLRLLQIRLLHAPELVQAHARHAGFRAVRDPPASPVVGSCPRRWSATDVQPFDFTLPLRARY